MKKILNVLYQSDNNYADLTGVSITSLFENNKHMDEINVYILNNNINDTNINKLIKLASMYDRKIILLDTSDILNKLKELKVEPHKGTYTTYFKLLAIKQLNLATDRVLQIDGDTIINKPLDELLEINLDNKMCAATYDCMWNDYKTCLGIDVTDKYYNCGVLLINQKYWIEKKCEERIIEHLLTVRNKYYIVDQDIINVLFRNEITYLDLKYNFNSGFYIYGVEESFKIYDLNDNYYDTVEKVIAASKDPYIYHCMGAMTGRPWEQGNIHPQSDLYDKYMAISPWKNDDKKIVTRTFMYNTQRKLYLLLPRFLYGKVHRAALKKFYRDMNNKVLNS